MAAKKKRRKVEEPEKSREWIEKPIKQQLRREVGFGCPIPGCGSPYLEWHHFDPPWREGHTNDPDGMIALCSKHHRMADAGTYTIGQLHEFKRAAGQHREKDVQGKFDWLRHKLLAVVGGGAFYETLQIFAYYGQPIIWFTRDEEGYLRLNIKMLSCSGKNRLIMENNLWVLRGEPTDFECPPSGRLIHAKYDNEDELRIEFLNIASKEAALKRYPSFSDFPRVEFPVVGVEVRYKVAGLPVDFDKSSTKFWAVGMHGSVFTRCGCGLRIDHTGLDVGARAVPISPQSLFSPLGL
jgi:hypothetical protein